MAGHCQALSHHGSGRAGQGSAPHAAVGEAYPRGAACGARALQESAEASYGQTTVPAGKVGGIPAASRGAAQATRGRRQSAQAGTEIPRQTERKRARADIDTRSRSRQVKGARGARMATKGTPFPAAASVSRRLASLLYE